MRPHAQKPFPLSFFELRKFKVAHYMLFWFLCNELDEDEEGWIRISRKNLASLYRERGACKITNISAVMFMLHTEGYIHMEWTKTKDTNYEDFAIRICDEAWNPRVVHNKVYACSTTRSERRQRQLQQLSLT